MLPTDTVYGLAALPLVPGAIARIFALKGRRPEVPLAVLGGRRRRRPGPGRDRGPPSSSASPPPAGPAPSRWWWDGHRRGARGWDLGGDPRTIGIRCPDHRPGAGRDRPRSDPIATTSANAHGSAHARPPRRRPPPPSPGPGRGGGRRGPAGGRSASTVVDATGPGPRPAPRRCRSPFAAGPGRRRHPLPLTHPSTPAGTATMSVAQGPPMVRSSVWAWVRGMGIGACAGGPDVVRWGRRPPPLDVPAPEPAR